MHVKTAPGSPACTLKWKAASESIGRMYVNTLPATNTLDPNIVSLVAHVPEHARIFVGGEGTSSTGKLRMFQTPPLTPGKKYVESVRVDWVEDGKWMSQKHNFPVSAGGIYCVYLMKKGASLESKEPVTANLSKLSAEDRKEQCCSVQHCFSGRSPSVIA
jgi:uncharacterized protein (TIGR03000 family)